MREGDVTLEPLGPEHAADLRRIRSEPAVECWWDPVEDDFPLEDEPESTRYAIVVSGTIAGMIQYAEVLEPKYRSSSIDIFVDPAFHGRGVGSTAVRLVRDHLVAERGHHRVEIDPAAANTAAVRCYEKAGFTRVGILRLAERDAYDHSAWHDSLMMEYVVEPSS